MPKLPMTKSTLRLAREALTVGQQALSPYASRFSKHDFTQPQLFALWAVRQFLVIECDPDGRWRAVQYL